MKNSVLTLLLLLASHLIFAQAVYWISSGASTWGTGGSWSLSSGGPACGCIPGVGNIAIFDGVGGNGQCTLDQARSVGALQMTGYAGNINLNGFTLTVGGLATNNTLNTGTISGAATLTFTATSNVSFSGTDLVGASTNLSATLTTSTGVFTGGAGSTFDGSVNVSAYSILLNGSVYNGTAAFTKTGDVVDAGAGGNTFNQATSITNTSGRALRTAATTGDTFNSSLVLTENSNNVLSSIQVAYGTGTATFFNGDVQVNSTDNGSNIGGISFGANGGSSQLASGFTIAEGSGFLIGTLELRNFTQLGNTAQTLNLSWPGAPSASALILVIASSTFNGNVSFTASNLDLGGNNTFNGSANTFTKATGGSSTTNVAGNNIFNQAGGGGTTVFNNNTTSTVNLAASLSGDTFNGDVTFNIVTSTGRIRVAQSGTSFFYEDIIITYVHATPTMAVPFGTVEFTGASPQTISNNRNLLPQFSTFRMHKTTNNVQLNAPIEIVSTLDMTTGLLLTTATNYVSILDAGTAISTNDASYVEGPVRKTGDDGFTFPVGEEGFYRPISISAPSNANDVFTAQYFHDPYSSLSPRDAPLIEVTDCDYWTLARTNGISGVSVTLSWNDAACGTGFTISSLADLRVARWDNTSWKDHGNNGTPTGDATSGTITTSASVTLFPLANNPFALATVSALNVLPIELINFEASLKGSSALLSWQTASEHNNDHFVIEQSSTGKEFLPIGRVDGAGTTKELRTYSFTDTKPFAGKNYYRIVQNDFDGKKEYSPIRYVYIEHEDKPLQVDLFPNPARFEVKITSTHFLKKTTVVVHDCFTNMISWKKEFDLFGWEQLLSIDDLKSGLYYVSVSSEENRSFTKLAVVK